jgi:hypothetical protein
MVITCKQRILALDLLLWADRKKDHLVKHLHNLPTYQGIGYRFVVSPNPTLTVEEFKAGGGQYQSWAKSLVGINAEVALQQDLPKEIKGNYVHLFRATISGRDLQQTVRNLWEWVISNPKEKGKDILYVREYTMQLLWDFDTNEEVICEEMPEQVEHIGVFDKELFFAGLVP